MGNQSKNMEGRAPYIFKRILGIPPVLGRLFFLCYTLGDGLWEKIRLSFFILFSRVKNFWGLSQTPLVKEFRLGVNGQGIKLQISNDFADTELLREIFIEQEYRIQVSPEPKVVFDLGSNAGFTAIYFKSLFPHARIFCFEPDPDIFRRLDGNIKIHPHIIAFQYAVSGSSGRRAFYQSPEFHMRNSFISRDARERKVEVPCLTLDEAIALTGVEFVDLLKFDVEGAEAEIFANFHSWNRVGCIIGEVHQHLIGSRAIDNLFETLKKHYQISIHRRNNKILIEGRRRTPGQPATLFKK